jgi:hypothetical protein
MIFFHFFKKNSEIKLLFLTRILLKYCNMLYVNILSDCKLNCATLL